MQFAHIYKGGDRPMSNADIAEINLLKKQPNQAESRVRMLQRNREIKKKRERMLAQWFSESKIDTNEELSDLYVKRLLAKEIKRMSENAK